MLMTLYGGGCAGADDCSNEGSGHGSPTHGVRNDRGKGGHAREVPLDPDVLAALRKVLA